MGLSDWWNAVEDWGSHLIPGAQDKGFQQAYQQAKKSPTGQGGTAKPSSGKPAAPAPKPATPAAGTPGAPATGLGGLPGYNSGTAKAFSSVLDPSNYPTGYHGYFNTVDASGHEVIKQGSMTYQPGAEYTAWGNMTAQQKADTKKMLYYSGMYAPNAKVVISGGTFTPDDIAALGNAMNLANLNGAPDYTSLLQPWAEQGLKTGKPFSGSKGDGSDTVSAAQIAQQAAQFETTINQFAFRNGIKLSDGWKKNAFSNILAGNSSQDEILQGLREKTVTSAFPSLAEQIKGGMDVLDIASPYIQAKASLLETDPQAITLDDGQIRSALQSRDTNGKPSTVPLYQFEQQVRLDPRWKNTQNAKQTVSTMAAQVLKDFGFQQ